MTPDADCVPPFRTTHNDIGIVRVLEEREPGRFATIANYATDAEATAFLEGVRYAETGERNGLTASTYARALATVKARQGVASQ